MWQIYGRNCSEEDRLSWLHIRREVFILNAKFPNSSILFSLDEEWVSSSLSAYGCLGAVPRINYDVISQGKDLFSDIAN